jgi:hypothetical protein
MWTEIIIAKGPGSEKFQPQITMRMDLQNCWLTSVMIETNSAVKTSINVFRDLLDELARAKVLQGSSVSQLKARYIPTSSAKISSNGIIKTKRVYRDTTAQPSKVGSAQSEGSQMSMEEALEKFHEEMERQKQIELETKPSGIHASNI